jgi:hypothetical protein
MRRSVDRQRARCRFFGHVAMRGGRERRAEKHVVAFEEGVPTVGDRAPFRVEAQPVAVRERRAAQRDAAHVAGAGRHLARQCLQFGEFGIGRTCGADGAHQRHVRPVARFAIDVGPRLIDGRTGGAQRAGQRPQPVADVAIDGGE